MGADLLRWLGQGVVYAALAAVLGYFSAAPAYRHLEAGQAVIKMTFTHGGSYKGGCRQRTAEELRELAPNMRRKFDCPRKRVPVTVELDVDGETLYSASRPPSGLHGDGPSIMYRSFQVPAGEHRLSLRLRDSERQSGFDYERERTVTLRPGQLLVVQFRTEAGGFTIRE